MYSDEEVKEQVEETIEKIQTKEGFEEFFNSPEFQKMYAKMHTPWRRRYEKIGRNDVCPFCNSGKKFKNCECYEKYNNTPKYTINYGKNS